MQTLQVISGFFEAALVHAERWEMIQPGPAWRINSEHTQSFLNAHVGNDHKSYEDVMGEFGVSEKNQEDLLHFSILNNY